MNFLELRYDAERDEGLTLRPFVDGDDLLDRFSNSTGMDPHDLLPPMSTALLPSALASEVILGRCDCGEVGCGSFAVTLRRDGDSVWWQPLAGRPHETLADPLCFELRQYLDAVDAAAANPPATEGRGRRVVRIITVASAADERKWDTGSFGEAGVDWVAAWPWTGDGVQVSITRRGEQEINRFAPRVDETDEQFAARIRKRISDLRFD